MPPTRSTPSPPPPCFAWSPSPALRGRISEPASADALDPPLPQSGGGGGPCEGAETPSRAGGMVEGARRWRRHRRALDDDGDRGARAADVHDRHCRVLRRRRSQSHHSAAQALEHSGGGDRRPARGRADAHRLCRARNRDRLLARRARLALALFLHRHRPQRQARRPHFGRPAFPRAARPDARLSRHPEPHRRRQRRGARPAERDHALSRLGLAHRRTRHHDRLGADHRSALRARQRARSRHRRRDAWTCGRQPGRRPDRRLPHLPSPTERTVGAGSGCRLAR